MKKMSIYEWEKLRKANPDKYIELCRDFLCDGNNSHMCEYCPMNNDMEGAGKLPCGQYHCHMDIYEETCYSD